MDLHKIFFTSEIETKYADQVEQLFFFNENQKRYYSKIEKSCEKFGTPKLDKNGKYIKFFLGESDKFQTLYVFDKGNEEITVLGLLIYIRPKEELIEVVHIAVTEECSEGGRYNNEMVVIRTIERLRLDSQRIKGVKKIKLPYSEIEIDITKSILNTKD